MGRLTSCVRTEVQSSRSVAETQKPKLGRLILQRLNLMKDQTVVEMLTVERGGGSNHIALAEKYS